MAFHNSSERLQIIRSKSIDRVRAHDAPDFYLNSETLRIRRVTAIAGKPGGILEEPEVIRAQTS